MIALMKKMIPALFASLLLLACNKDDVTTFDPSNLSYFKYKINGGTEVTADSAWWFTGSNATGIRVFTGAQQSFEISWAVGFDTTFTGAKQLLPGGILYYVTTPASTNSSNQILNVTNFNNRFMSGNMQATTAGAATQIEASFNKLSRK